MKRPRADKLPEALVHELGPKAAVRVPIVIVPQQNGLVRLVGPHDGLCLGVAVNRQLAESTRRFFA